MKKTKPMKLVYHILLLMVFISFIIVIGCFTYLSIFGYVNNLNIFMYAILVCVFAMFSGVGAITLQVELICRDELD